ncbi:MAG: ATP-binding protein [Proteobacteria bacterium]|nr:ATP-binding protein [Pseudomonadota bacterium]
MWIKREISEIVLQASRQFPALALTGSRQTGKTSLLKQLFPHHNYVSLEDPSLAALAESDMEQFLARYQPPVIIDEVQYAPQMFRRLKAIIDANRHSMGQFLLTGSQKFALMKEVGDSLAGRCALLELEPLSCGELQTAHLLQNRNSPAIFAYIARGFFPELWRNPDADSLLFYRSYLGTYIERDVRQILNIGSLRDFDRFIRSCALRSGQLLNKTELSKDVGVTQNTINQWLSVLEASNQISLLEPYFSSKRKQLVKTPKLFFNDSGFLCFMLGLDQNSLAQYAGVGHIWETLVYSELRKLRDRSTRPMSIWYYQEQKKTEVDFVIETGGKLHAIEVKLSSNPDPSHHKQLNAFAEDYPDDIGSLWLACRAEVSETSMATVTTIHVFDLAAALAKLIDGDRA